MRFTFRFRWLPFIAASIAAVIGISLGQWQARRAVEKEMIEARMAERAGAAPLLLNAGIPGIDEAEYRRAIVRGEFVRDWPLYLDNRPYKGEAGFYVLMPFRLAGSQQYVLVARGWIRRDAADRTRLSVMPPPAGLTEVVGMVRHHPGHVLQLGRDEPVQRGAIVQNVSVREVAQASKLDFAPFVLEQLNDTHDGLIRDWPRPSSGVERHRGYAFQWYALAATALVFFVVTGFRRERN
ncbi:SURF1 family protein [Noviherbaspirillum autotrophicum]|uniref:SURF1-like protein n=1 Tax=Noviherbaspirillum autotrophicum TaxID=709839 RepID=A0A0C2BPQ3_9BURK|nr:SURF1 family protein [Noviherbaspirillum autotrophicum]KIF80031.1 cytochrome oxidase complex biogenesis factor transmembrane protein [Noviherbaspirillum autotrophicum]